jgi:hypothetical protein
MAQFANPTGPAPAITATDGGAFDTDGVVNNAIRFFGHVGNVDINVAVSTTNAPGSPDLAAVGMASGIVTNLSPAAQTLLIATSSTGFNSPTSPPAVEVNSSASLTVGRAPTPGVVMKFTSYTDPSNAAFGTAIATPTVTLNATTGRSASGDASPTFALVGNLYSITNLAEYSIPGSLNGVATFFSSSGTTNVNPASAPAPSALALALAGLPLLGMAWFRRAGRKASA